MEVGVEMRIALHDSDYNGFPNYALMKLSAWHKAQGDHVEWWIPMVTYDKVYSSKIFTFSPEDPNLPEGTIKCGTGYGNLEKLPQEIDDMMPDYSLYPRVEHSIGFITRGCIRKCPWCIVPKKEGMILSIHYLQTTADSTMAKQLRLKSVREI